MENSKQPVIDGVNMWQTTRYRYITRGSNWAWGRNKVENKVWAVLVSTTMISFVIGASVGAWLGWNIWSMLSSYDMGYWPIVWTVLLALMAGILFAILIVQIVYRILWPLIEAARNISDASK